MQFDFMDRKIAKAARKIAERVYRLLGCDLTHVDEFTMNLLGNDEVAVHRRDARVEQFRKRTGQIVGGPQAHAGEGVRVTHRAAPARARRFVANLRCDLSHGLRVGSRYVAMAGDAG